MATERFKEWVNETKEACHVVEESPSIPTHHSWMLKAIVFALLTIAIAIHEAAEKKK